MVLEDEVAGSSSGAKCFRRVSVGALKVCVGDVVLLEGEEEEEETAAAVDAGEKAAADAPLALVQVRQFLSVSVSVHAGL